MIFPAGNGVYCHRADKDNEESGIYYAQAGGNSFDPYYVARAIRSVIITVPQWTTNLRARRDLLRSYLPTIVHENFQFCSLDRIQCL